MQGGSGSDQDPLTAEVIGAAIEVHRKLGPGLLESVYETCMADEFSRRGVPFSRQIPLTVEYKAKRLDADLRIDLLVSDRVIVELKAVESLMPIHNAQLLTYMRLARKPTGLLINFNVPVLRDGVCRLILSQFLPKP